MSLRIWYVYQTLATLPSKKKPKCRCDNRHSSQCHIRSSARGNNSAYNRWPGTIECTANDASSDAVHDLSQLSMAGGKADVTATTVAEDVNVVRDAAIKDVNEGVGCTKEAEQMGKGVKSTMASNARAALGCTLARSAWPRVSRKKRINWPRENAPKGPPCPSCTANATK